MSTVPQRERPTEVACFHCWERFDLTSFHGAREARRHFGEHPLATPACVLDRSARGILQTLRDTEAERNRLRAELEQAVGEWNTRTSGQ